LSADEQIFRRRALYRAAHRGTKEMDLLLGRFAAAYVPGVDSDGLRLFETFLKLPDPLIEGWIMGSRPPESPFADLVQSLRRFHGL